MQAVLLGLSAAFSHTLVIRVLAAVGLHFSGQLDVEGLEPWFQPEFRSARSGWRRRLVAAGG